VKRSTPPPAEQHLTLAQLAERLQVTERTIYEWNVTGFGPPYIRAGRMCRYRLSDIETWEQANLIDRGRWR